jgi:hypothetical protein
VARFWCAAVGARVRTNRAAGCLDSIDPREVEGAFRDIELAHRRDTQLILCQELRPTVPHEWKQPVAASPPLSVGFLREFLGFGSSSSNISNRKPGRIIQIGDLVNMAQ